MSFLRPIDSAICLAFIALKATLVFSRDYLYRIITNGNKNPWFRSKAYKSSNVSTNKHIQKLKCIAFNGCIFISSSFQIQPYYFYGHFINFLNIKKTEHIGKFALACRSNLFKHTESTSITQEMRTKLTTNLTIVKKRGQNVTFWTWREMTQYLFESHCQALTIIWKCRALPVLTMWVTNIAMNLN